MLKSEWVEIAGATDPPNAVLCSAPASEWLAHGPFGGGVEECDGIADFEAPERNDVVVLDLDCGVARVVHEDQLAVELHVGVSADLQRCPRDVCSGELSVQSSNGLVGSILSEQRDAGLERRRERDLDDVWVSLHAVPRVSVLHEY